MIRTGSALAKANVLKDATSRDFRGGLDVADSELNLSSKYARELKNMVIGVDGSLQVRQGTRLFANLEPLTDYPIVNERYFMTNIISVDEVGQMFATKGDGTTTRIWDSLIATHTRSGLSIWGDTRFVGFEEFDGELIVYNGKDKPIAITSTLSVDYLADKATGSNVNVPVAGVATKHARHFIWASGSLLIASERDASGTYADDPGAVYAGTFDLSSYVTSGSTEILGMMSFKGFLLVYFQECIVPVTLEETTGTDAALVFNVSPDSIIVNYGTVSQRTIQDIGEQALALDIVGVGSSALTKFTKILSPDRPSRFIDKLLQRAINDLDLPTLKEHAFALFDRKSSTYMVFLPNTTWHPPTKSRGFAYRYLPQLDVAAWSTLDGWNWRCGTRSSEGRIFLTPMNSRRIYVLGDEVNDPIYADFVGEQETFSDGTTFTDGKGLTPITSLATSGVPIKWAWEMPWSDLKHRGNVKTLRYIIPDTEGNQAFTVQVFVDNKYEVRDGGEAWKDTTLFTDGTGFIRSEPERTPALELDFIGKDAGGYGVQAYGTSPFGSGNNTAQHGLTLTPTKMMLMKLRFSGSAMGPLKFSAITIMYQVGSVRRMIV